MKRFKGILLTIAMLFAITFSASADANTCIVEFDGDEAVAFLTFEFATFTNGAAAMMIGYYPFMDITFFMPEFTIEQEHCSAKYDVYGINNKIYISSPKWYDFGASVPSKQSIVMYIALPYNFRVDMDVTVYIETANGMIWHQFCPANFQSEEATFWYNGKQLQN